MRDSHGAALDEPFRVVKAWSGSPSARVEVATENVAAGWVDEGRRGPGTDVLGRLWFRVLRDPTDDLLRAVFSASAPDVPDVFLVPRKPETARLPLHVAVRGAR